jgi:hypothetical protein
MRVSSAGMQNAKLELEVPGKIKNTLTCVIKWSGLA